MASKGQAMVEMSLILPVVLLLLGVAWTASDAMHNSIGLTSAARAGAIIAAGDLTLDSSSAGRTTALNAATAAVNAEEGTSGPPALYTTDDGSSLCPLNCVTLTYPTNSSSINLAQITITHSVLSGVPLVSSIDISAHATARY